MGVHIADSLDYEAIARLAKTSVEDIAGKANDHLKIGYNAMANKYGQDFANKAVAESIAKFGIDGTNKIVNIGSNIRGFFRNYLPSFEEKRGSLGNKVINDFKNLDNINKETAYQSITGDKGTFATKLESLGTELTKDGQIPKTAENIKNVKTVLDDVSSTLDATLSTEKGMEAINKHHVTPYEYFNTGNSSIDTQRRVTAGVIAGVGTIGLINHRNNNRPY